MKELSKNQSVNLGFNGNNPAPTKEFLAAIDEGEKLAHNPNAKTYSTPRNFGTSCTSNKKVVPCGATICLSQHHSLRLRIAVFDHINAAA